MTNQDPNDQNDKEEGVVKLLTAGIEGYFFKWEWAMVQEIAPDMDPMLQTMLRQSYQEKIEQDSQQGGDKRISDEIKKNLINIFTKLASDNLRLKRENAILKNKIEAKEPEKKATTDQ